MHGTERLGKAGRRCLLHNSEYMDEIIRALILGIVQGLTEFLPVSSSGHLELAKYFLGDQSVAAQSMLMTVTLHGATALSTIVVFRKDIGRLLGGLWVWPRRAGRWHFGESQRYTAKIVLSMVPAAAVGLLFEEELEALFDRQVVLVCLMLFVTGALLLLADRARHTDRQVGFGHSLIIGLAQAFAILPGISRSGSTIATSVLLGIDRNEAARFSFLMVVPLILGKMAKDVLDGAFAQKEEGLAVLAVGFVAAFASGLLACTWMISLVRRAKLRWFALYCFGVGAVVLLLYFL